MDDPQQTMGTSTDSEQQRWDVDKKKGLNMRMLSSKSGD
jgi:peroxiredoxin